MFGIALGGQTAAITTLVIVAVMFVLFIREDKPPEVIALGTAALMLVLGLVPLKDATEVLSNNAPWTIAFMFIIMGGLLRTGALEIMSRLVTSRVSTHPRATLCGLFGFVIVASAVMNNTPVVAVMIPIVIQVARKGTDHHVARSLVGATESVSAVAAASAATAAQARSLDRTWPGPGRAGG